MKEVPMRIFTIITFAFLVSVFVCKSDAASIEQKPGYVYAICSDVVNEMTLSVNIMGTKKELKLIGIDASSKGGFVQKAKQIFGGGPVEYLKENVKGKKLYIEFEDNWAAQTNVLEGYVRLKDDGTFINIDMIKKGFALTDKSKEFKYKNDFLKAEKGNE